VSFRAHAGKRVRCWSVVASCDRGEDIKQRPTRDRVMIQVAAELLIQTILEHLVDGLGLWMQYRHRTDHVHATALIDGRNGPRPVSSNASLNHRVKHCHIAAGRCITFETIRRGVSPARRGGHPGDAVFVIHLMKTEQFVRCFVIMLCFTVFRDLCAAVALFGT